MRNREYWTHDIRTNNLEERERERELIDNMSAGYREQLICGVCGVDYIMYDGHWCPGRVENK